MSLTSQQYAALADDVYKKPREVGADSSPVNIGGVSYKRLEYMDTPSGYQGVIYQRVDNGEIVVAHRGSEFGRQPIQDGLSADGGMVATRHNAQAADAIELTRHAMNMAELQAKRDGHRPEVTVTGHSLGGGLTQITAHHFGLKGQTFNAYGAVSLDRRIPEGGHDVINHVMAGDPVSAASRHYGEVRIYAAPKEIAKLEQHGYDDSRGTLDLRNPLAAAVGLGDSHRMHNFLPVDSDGKPDRSVLDGPASQQLVQQHAPMIEKYRGDVASLRIGVTLGARGWQGLLVDGIDELRGPLPPGAGRNEIGVPTWPEHMQQLHGTQQPSAASQDWRAPLKVPLESMAAVPNSHFDDPLYRMLRDKLPADIPTATVMHATVEAKREGLHRPEQVKSVQEHNGSIWIEGTTPGFRVQVETAGAVPSLQDSVRQGQTLDQQRAQVEPAVQQPAARVH